MPPSGSTTFQTSPAPYTLTQAGQKVLDTYLDRSHFAIQNRGVLPVLVYYNTDGSGNPVFVIGAGVELNDGLGGMWIDEKWKGPVFLKSSGADGAVITVTAF